MSNFAVNYNKRKVMTPAEYIQLKAFARIDGAIVGLMWIASFASYVGGLTTPGLGFVAMLLGVGSLVVAALRLRRFRDYAREGVISFARAAAYFTLIFLYASLLLALAQYVYFAFIDGGYLVSTYTSLMSTPEAAAMMKAYGVDAQQMGQSISLLAQTDPIYIVLNILSMNVTAGVLMSLPVAAIVKRKEPVGHTGEQ